MEFKKRNCTIGFDIGMRNKYSKFYQQTNYSSFDKNPKKLKSSISSQVIIIYSKPKNLVL
jgi:hypothetical protein